MSDFPDWIHPGASVAIISGGSWGPPSIQMATVDRITATQVAIGTRKFKVADTEIREMVAADSDRLAGWREEWRIVAVLNAAHDAVDKWKSYRKDRDLARAAGEALIAYADTESN